MLRPMPYPGEFVRLVILGELYSDVFNTTLSIVPSALGEISMPSVNQATLEAVAAAVETWWENPTAGTGARAINQSRLTGIKLNRIGADGRYMDSPTMEFTYPTPIAGTSTGTAAPQLSLVATLRTALARGRGSKGRMYLPPTAPLLSVGADGRVTVGNATDQANAVRTLINAVNGEYIAIGRVGVASDAGAGRFEHVTSVSVGRVIDTMRSRRSAQEEDYQTVVL